tara:strand:- start:1 stop:450 length:450 start_codon:yes stop_codon:yes gene_type:complete
MKIENRKISELRFADYNPRTISKKEYKDLKASLQKFGIVDPVIINGTEDRDGVIIGGHQRTRIWQELENPTIPCVVLELSLALEMELNLRLNKNGGKFDADLLLNCFDEELLFEVGFTVNDLDINIDKYEEEKLEAASSDTCECCGAPI